MVNLFPKQKLLDVVTVDGRTASQIRGPLSKQLAREFMGFCQECLGCIDVEFYINKANGFPSVRVKTNIKK